MENAISSDLVTVALEAWNCSQAMNSQVPPELFQSYICKSAS